MRSPAVIFGALFAAALAGVAVSPAAAFTADEKTDIQAIVRDYLVKNPEVLLEAIDALQAKRQEAQKTAQKDTIAKAGDALFSSPKGTVLGNPDGDVTVVEFFDYNCAYCRHALDDMQTLLKQDPKIRFVLKEIPVLGPQSVEATRVSLALRSIAPEKYGAFHQQLLGTPGVADEDRAISVAEGLGVEEAALRKAMADPKVTATIAEDGDLANLLQINGTPSYVIADEVLPGAVGLEEILKKVKNVRNCASATC